MKHNFEKLTIWQDAVDLAVEVCLEVDNSRNFALKDQLTRSSISVPSNIAEGCERQTAKELSRFLNISGGSSGEVRTQLIIAKRINQIDESKADNLVDRYRKLSSQIYAFKKKLEV
ncbi:four helix bundle protein [uncultured Imperialibacter sp.]|uniref:four helix bundle protein n=1 Tax=uncultured Imperialibacter sp. TaxID=1672639 RepID=UPI0030D82218|tara:strand:- start:165 stop:512 length:348 start_codon:yes stop_codon:yes gene_type:complete